MEALTIQEFELAAEVAHSYPPGVDSKFWDRNEKCCGLEVIPMLKNKMVRLVDL